MNDADRHYRFLLAQLAGLRRRAVFLDLSAGLILALAVGLGLGWAWIGLEALLYLSPPFRTGMGLVVATLTGGSLVFYLGGRLPARLSRRRFSLHVERCCPELRQRLISALELWGRPRALRLYSADLLAATVAAAAGALQSADRRAILDFRPLKTHARYLGLVAGLAAGTFVLFSGGMAAALHRCAHPLTAFVREPRTRIGVVPGDLEIVKGEDATIKIHFQGRRPRTARVLRREIETAPWRGEEIIVERADSLTYTFKQVRGSFSYQIRAGDGSSPVHQVAVIDPPSVSRLRLKYQYPAYSRLPVRIEEESGDIHSLAGTRVDFEIIASKRLKTAALVRDDTLRRPARVRANRAYVDLEVTCSGHYHVELEDVKGVANRDPIRYAIEVLADAPPRVTVTDPGRDMDLPESMQILLAAEAVDDFGIQSLSLVHRINDGEEQDLSLDFQAAPEVNLTYLWDLSASSLLPEDRVYYRIEALDNDQVSGPKKSISREYVLRFPSLHELFEEVTQAQEGSRDELEELAEEGRQTRQYLEQVRRELLKTEELSWEQKKELEATLERELERTRAVEELAQELERTLEKLEENGLASEEILEKLEEIRALMEEVITPELRQALEELQRAVERQDPLELAEALRRFNEDQQTFQERLDRTLSLLEQVRAEQQLEAAVQQAADLEQRQARINEEMELGGDGERLQTQEGSLRRDTERLQQELEGLSHAVEPFSQKAAEDLAARAAGMQQKELTGRMQEMIQHLEAAPNPRARRLGRGLEEDLGELAAGMQQLQGEFVAEQKDYLAGDIARAMRDLLQFSQQQEALRNAARQRRQTVPSPLAEEQFALMQGVAQVVEDIGAVGRRTMSLEPSLVATLGYALRRMQEAAQHLGQQEAARAVQPQTASMQHLNEAVLLLRESLDNLAQARMPSSFGEAMQKMLGLSEQQAALNQATQQAFAQGQLPGQQGRNTRAEIARLAGQQRRIFAALQELQRAARGHRGAQQRIGAIEEEMKEVLTDMERRRLNPRTLNSQNRILQRMLDAGRSLHTQGFEEKRRSADGQDRAYAGPAWLPEDLGQSYDHLREAMRRALEGPYPDEYRTLIRRYYEQLYQDANAWEEAARP